MTILTSADKEKIKRIIPKSSNKIIDAAVIRLYVNYPNPDQWNWTGLTGAIVLVDDLIGHTFFFKLIDIIGNQGVLWDQELWVDFQYSQDRLFFHSFEIENYSIGFLFEDKSEAQHFFKRVINRQKHASKLTIQNNNAVEARKKPDQISTRGYRGNEIDDNDNNNNIMNEQRMRRTRGILYYDNEPPPEWRSFYKELESMGITEDMIADNREFIKDYIAKKGGPLVGLEPPIPRRYQNQVRDFSNNSVSRSNTQSLRSRSNTVNSVNSDRKKKAPPPPPPPGASNAIEQQDNYPDIEDVMEQPSNDNNDSYSSSISTTHTPTPTNTEPHHVHNVPPPMTFPNQLNSQPNFTSSISNSNTPGLPPRMVPATPARTLPSLPNRNNLPPAPPARGNVPPPPPARGNVPPPPPSRGSNAPAPPPARRSAPAPPPSRHANSTGTMTASPVPPSLPPGHPDYNPYQQQQQQQIPIQPQIQQQIPAQAQVQQQQISAIPPAPPMSAATSSIPPPPPMPSSNSSAPPPPPMPSFNNSSGPPPPPALPQMSNNPPRIETTGDNSRDALLASIRSAGIGSLKKVDKSQLDKPSVLLQEARGEQVSTPSSSTAAPGGGAPGQPASLADALAAALSSRKAKVAVSDDESDGDW